MRIFVHKRFEDIEENCSTAEKYPEMEVFCAVYQKIKGYKASENTVKFYEKVARPLETFLLSIENKWETYRKDMREISTHFPFLYFVVIEEDWNCPVARYCYHNGKVTGGYTKIIYVPFRREDLE